MIPWPPRWARNPKICKCPICRYCAANGYINSPLILKQPMTTQTVTPPTKLQATLNSRNFLVSLLSIIFSVFAFNGAPVAPDAAGSIVDAFGSGSLMTIIAVLVPNLLNPIMKLIAQKTWTWKFIKSPNFWIQVLSALLVGLTAIGLVFPDGTAAMLVEAIFGGNVNNIISVLALNVLNTLYHFFFDKKGS